MSYEPLVIRSSSERKRRYSRNHQRIEPVFPIVLVGSCASPLYGDSAIVLYEASNDGLKFKSDSPPEVGDVVDFKMRGLRHFSAMITAVEPGGFVAMPTFTTDIKSFANEIVLISRDQAAEAKRRHQRFVPERTDAVIKLPGGDTIKASVIDVSISGAAIESDLRPPIRSELSLGPIDATVVRHLPNGFAVEFKNVLSKILVQSFDEESASPKP